MRFLYTPYFSKKKKLLSVILSVGIIFCFTTNVDFSVSAKQSGDYRYNVLDNNNAEIVAYTGNESTTITIPSMIDKTFLLKEKAKHG